MRRYIDADEAIKVMACEMYAEAQSQGYDVDGVEDFIPEATAWMNDAPSIDIVMCHSCRKCKEQGGHANCNGYLYCTRQKTLVDEDCFCSWGERREP